MLTIDDDDMLGGSLRRAGRVAKLYVYAGSNKMHSSLFPPLFDPVVLRIDETRITLIGIQLSSSRPEGSDMRVSEFVQVWRCSPLLDLTVPMPAR